MEFCLVCRPPTQVAEWRWHLYYRATVVCLAFLLFSEQTTTTRAQLPQAALGFTATPTPATSANPAEVIPPVPTRYFSDDALATSPSFADALNQRLAAFEHETTDQFVVAVFPKMQSGADIKDYCRRVFHAWGVAQKGVNNGIILFVFVQDHRLRISVGSGLEGSLTNPVCQDITNQITAAFKRGDFEGGLTTGVDAIVKTLRPQPAPSRAPL